MIQADRIRHSVVLGIEQVTSKLVTIGDHDNFADYDIDSLDRMSLRLAIEEDLDLEVTDLDPKDVDCVNDYIELIQALTSDTPTDQTARPTTGAVAAKKD